MQIRNLSQTLVLALSLGIFVSLALPGPALANTLSVADCVKCHEQQPAQIEANGAAHKTEIDCQACHEGHRPKVENNIPACSNCHEGEEHYAIENCLGCHDPHEPLAVKLEGELKAVCLTCHAEPAEEMAASPSKHESFACNFCHANQHGVIPECVECHSPHSDSMTQQDCAACHQAHKPLELMYADNTQSTLCAACHKTAYSKLTASKAKHSQVACVTCHAEKHGTVPQCADCHGQPHAEGIHARFPKCGECHSTAHDLNNWSSQQQTKKK